VVLLKIPSKKGVCHRRHTSPGWSPAASHKRSGPSPLCLKSIVAPAVTSLICFASLVATSPRLVASFTSTALGHKLVPVSAAVQGTTLIDQIETCVSSAMSPIDIAEFWLRHFPAR